MLEYLQEYIPASSSAVVLGSGDSYLPLNMDGLKTASGHSQFSSVWVVDSANNLPPAAKRSRGISFRGHHWESADLPAELPKNTRLVYTKQLNRVAAPYELLRKLHSLTEPDTLLGIRLDYKPRVFNGLDPLVWSPCFAYYVLATTGWKITWTRYEKEWDYTWIVAKRGSSVEENLNWYELDALGHFPTHFSSMITKHGHLQEQGLVLTWTNLRNTLFPA